MARVTLIETKRHADPRGWFSETFNARTFQAIDPDVGFVQDNVSLSRPVGVLRGLHFQAPPHAQAKLVRCVTGAIWDVAVDIRAGSPTYGRHVAVELSAENGRQLYIPAGYAHGFITLAPDTEVSYKVSAFYAPAAEAGLRWDDPALALQWPAPPSGPVISDKDLQLPLFSHFTSPFAYDGTPLAPLGG